MKVTELAIPGAYTIENQQFQDPRGTFLEWFKAPPFRDATGRDLSLRQANMSLSAAGVVRGIHFADVPPGQAKYVMCPKGAVLDFAVDIRVGSPTYGQWDSVLLDDVDRRAIFLSEGLGHAFISLQDDSTVVYLCSTEYTPGREHGISPLDPSIALRLPETGRDGAVLTPILSEKDTDAPTLAEAKERGLLPTLQQCAAFVTEIGAISL